MNMMRSVIQGFGILLAIASAVVFGISAMFIAGNLGNGLTVIKPVGGLFFSVLFFIIGHVMATPDREE